MSSIKCNGIAWGLECPQRTNCAHRITPEQWQSDVKTGIPTGLYEDILRLSTPRQMQDAQEAAHQRLLKLLGGVQ